jgi:predicted DCC family thiol-disulfide oxidoreductase YuxK
VAKLHTLVYDRDCGFCRWSIAKVLAWDRGRALRAVALQEPEAAHLLGGMAPELRMASWHLVAPDGRVCSGGRAVEPLFRLLPGGRPVAAVAAIFPGLTESGYRWVARNRRCLGRLLRVEACSLDPGRRHETVAGGHSTAAEKRKTLAKTPTLKEEEQVWTASTGVCSGS